MRYYTETRDWIEYIEHTNINKTNTYARIGITKKAIDDVGPVVWADLPKVGQSVQSGDVVVVIESTKAAVDIYAPLSGIVTQVNPKMAVEEEHSGSKEYEIQSSNSDGFIAAINDDPEGTGWLYELYIK